MDKVSDVSMVKDDTEFELERLVFGDDAGFHERLRSFGDGAALPKAPTTCLNRQRSPEDTAEDDLEGVDDSGVCWIYKNRLS